MKVFLSFRPVHLFAFVLSLVLASCTQTDDGNVVSDADQTDKLVKNIEQFNAAAASLQQPTVSVPQLPIVWKALAQGKPVWKYASIDAILDDKIMEPEAVEAEEKGEAAAAQVYSLVYGPDNHNTELIESVLRRNANYEGHWDVATDSIWKILPPKAEQKTQGKAAATTAVGGDAAWLTELRDSIKSNSEAAGLQTPPVKSNNPDSTNKTPNDAAVSSFFEGLLS